MKEFIEIPFGAKDSELGGWEYNIPEGYTASIENGKIIVKKEESEDERIRRSIIEYIKDQQSTFISAPDCKDKSEEEENNRYNSWIAWLEKQGADISSFPKEQQVFMRKYVSLDKITLIKLLAERDANNAEIIESFEKQGEQNQKHFELKAGHWYICHRAFCCRADHLTVKEGERFMCEKDGTVKGFVLKEPEKYFKEVCAPAPIEDEQTPTDEEMKILLQTEYEKGKADAIAEIQKSNWSEEDDEGKGFPDD